MPLKTDKNLSQKKIQKRMSDKSTVNRQQIPKQFPYILRSQETSLKKTIAKKQIVLFLDYDGTLTPMAKTPEQAVLSSAMKGLLQEMVGLKNCWIVIVSGRSLKNVRSMIRVRGLVYAGNHGLEIQGEGIDFKHELTARSKSVLRFLKSQLNLCLGRFSGTFIEDKIFTLSVHYRNLVLPRRIHFRDEVAKILAPYVSSGDIFAGEGKKVIEIRPPVKWDKGRAVLWLLKYRRQVCREPVFPVFLGDDVTDEDAFSAIEHQGWGILVGQPRLSRAQYFLSGPAQVYRFLKKVQMVKKDE